MTPDEFVSKLKRIAGVSVSRESDDLGAYLVVNVGGLKTDYFLMKYDTDLDNYMTCHYITLIRMLSAFI